MLQVQQFRLCTWNKRKNTQFWRVLPVSSGMWPFEVWRKFTDVSSTKWRQFVPPQHWRSSIRVHGVTPQRAVLFTVANVRISSSTYELCVLTFCPRRSFLSHLYHWRAVWTLSHIFFLEFFWLVVEIEKIQIIFMEHLAKTKIILFYFLSDITYRSKKGNKR
jgi:hypothetical protein